ncbi:hypothetical protein T439DRAFT_302391 [Meredithblackwellia eburnea MCA 4105]
MASIILTPQQRFFSRVVIAIFSFFVFKWIFWDSKPTTPPGEIAHPAILERITLGGPLSGQSLDTRKYPFLQTRINRDESPDVFDADIGLGIKDFWTRFQKPFALSSDTIHLDEQVVRGAVDELLGFNGWAAAACSSLTRPFGLQKKDDDWSDLARPGALYYFALVVHGADHFLIDQLAVIVQLSKRLGPNSIFVSLVDYASTDSTPFICDMAEAVMILLGISFRIRQVPPMTADPTASYYPLEEAYTRNLALEPLNELWERRRVKFTRVIWLKGFTCPNDILETLRVSVVNQAAMVCSMDWKEHNGFFIYNDRWRTRDMDGNLFRGSKSTSPIDEAPPRDALGGARYTLHLPFQVFCCESGSHIVDPHKSYYEGVSYTSSVAGVFNTSATADGKTPRWSEGPCMDSSQLHFCRDLWMVAFREGIRTEAKRLAAEERQGKGRNVHPFMEELIQAMQVSYAPPTSDRVGYANSGDYLADETGAAPGGGSAGESIEAPSDADAAADEEEGEEDGPVDADLGPEPGREEYDQDSGGDGRPIDLAVEIEEPQIDFPEPVVDAKAAVKPEVVVPAVKGALPVVNAPAAAAGEGVAQAGAAAAAAGAGAAAAAGAGAGAGAAKPKVEAAKPKADAAKPKAEPAKAPAGAGEKWFPVNAPGVAAPGPKAAGAKAGAEEKKAEAKVDEKKPDVWHPVVPGKVPGPPVPAAAGKNAPQKPPNPVPDPAKAAVPIAPVAPAPPQKAPAKKVAKRGLVSRAGTSEATHKLEKRRPRSLPNSDFDYAIAKILVNPRCVTTYAGVSHTQLALDLFGSGEDQEPAMDEGGKYVLDEWRTAPESFVCQEMRTTGGRIAAKQQRRSGFQMARLLLDGWRP